MSTGPQLYLVPCSCGETLRVRASQAGGQLTCQCGAMVSVPTIRGLKQLKMVADEAALPVARPVGLQGPLFATGVILLFVGCLVLAGTVIFPPAELKYDATMIGLTEADMERAKIPVNELGLDQLYDEFVALRDRGRSDQGRYVQSQIDQARKNLRYRQLTGVGLTGLGGLLTFFALLLPLLVKSPPR